MHLSLCLIVCRQMVARSLLDTLRAVSEDECECVSVLERIERLAEDSGAEPMCVCVCVRERESVCVWWYVCVCGVCV